MWTSRNARAYARQMYGNWGQFTQSYQKELSASSFQEKSQELLMQLTGKYTFIPGKSRSSRRFPYMYRTSASQPASPYQPSVVAEPCLHHGCSVPLSGFMIAYKLQAQLLAPRLAQE